MWKSLSFFLCVSKYSNTGLLTHTLIKSVECENKNASYTDGLFWKLLHHLFWLCRDCNYRKLYLWGGRLHNTWATDMLFLARDLLQFLGRRGDILTNEESLLLELGYLGSLMPNGIRLMFLTYHTEEQLPSWALKTLEIPWPCHGWCSNWCNWIKVLPFLRGHNRALWELLEMIFLKRFSNIVAFFSFD